MRCKSKLLIGLLFVAVVAGGLTYTPRAEAASDNRNAIRCGLWAGANFQLRTFESCPSTSEPIPKTNTYVALGDSVAAGLGLDAPDDNTADDVRCGRSGQSYANTVAQELQLPLTNAACSGATAGDLVTKQGVSGPNIAAQLETAFSSGIPKLITITAGANDVHWDEFIRLCYQTNCATRTATAGADAYLYALKLNYALSSIERRSNDSTPPMVIMTGYYNPISSSCVNNEQRITDAEVNWVNARTKQLNSLLKDTVKNYSFVRFAPVDFSGHDICSPDPWVQGADDVAPLHPTAQGQAVIAESVLAAYKAY